MKINREKKGIKTMFKRNRKMKIDREKKRINVENFTRSTKQTHHKVKESKKQPAIHATRFYFLLSFN